MKRFRLNLSANTLQLFSNQLFSLLTFYVLSRSLSKQDFGELNWTLAVFLLTFTLASCGFDQIVIRKAAEGKGLKHLLSLHSFHVLLTGFVIYLILLLTTLLFPAFHSAHPLLLLLGLGKLLLFLSTPFKAIASGSERFWLLLWMSVGSAVLKGLCLLLLFITHQLTLSAVILTFVLADAVEMLLSVLIFAKFFQFPRRLYMNRKDYLIFFKAALPQVGVVVLAAAITRMDWILIGLFSSPDRLAEYSFAYKAFEISTLPLLVVAPLLVPWFTRLRRTATPLWHHPQVQFMLRAEIMVACLTALCLNLLWNPFVDAITDGQYGAANTRTILILSMALPVMYLNNFLWSLHFAEGNLKIILHSFVLCFSLNVVGNLLLLPLYGNEGAAVAYLLSILVQTIYYAGKTEAFTGNFLALAACAACAFTSGYLTPMFTANTIMLLVCGSAIYVVLLVFTVQIRQKDWKLFLKTVAG